MRGTTLGHYEVLEQLGAGGMGEVYRAHDTNLDRDVALKVLRAGTVREEERKQFRREALALAKLKHPNIGVIHDFGSEDGVDFLVMELVEGADLATMLRDGARSEDQVVDVGIQIAQALEEAHEQSIVHCDLKPQNIMLTAKHQAKVLDFGLAKLVRPVATATTASMDELNSIAGTLPYMSPEQVQGKEVDARTDVYGLGATLYETATARRPHEHADVAQLIKAILYDEPQSPRVIRPEISQGLARVILTALRKKPSERYQTTAELRLDLERVQAGVPVVAPATSGRLKRLIMAGATALAVTALIVGTNLGGLRDRLMGRSQGPSLAVLPFKNFSGDPDQEYLVDGITDDLITKLHMLRSFEKVSAHQSVKRYRDTDLSLASIGQELGVHALLEGSVLVSGDLLQVSARLVEAETEASLWAEQYQRQTQDVFALLNDVTRDIASALDAVLSPAEANRLATSTQIAPAVYSLYQRGHFFMGKKSTPGMLHKAIEQFEAAIRADSLFALAYTGLAEAYWWLSIGYDDSEITTAEIEKQAEQATNRALDLDASLAEAQTLSGVLHVRRWDWPSAEGAFERALELAPNSPFAHRRYAEFLHIMGRFDEGIAASERAQDLDPLTISTITEVGWSYEAARQYDRAIEQFQKVLELEPNDPLARYNLGAQYIAKGMHEAGITELNAVLEQVGNEDLLGGLGCTSVLARAYALSGDEARARELLAELRDGWGKRFPTWQAGVHVALGENDEALRQLEVAYEQRSSMLPGITYTVPFDPLRGDPTFIALLQRMGLKDAIR